MPKRGLLEQVVVYGVLSVLLLAPAHLGFAAAQPNAGTILDSLKLPTVRLQQDKEKIVTIDGDTPVTRSDSQQTFKINELRLTGEIGSLDGELSKFTADIAGREVTLADLQARAEQITQHLRKRGYLVAIAFIPAQDIVDGIVKIVVVPGKYGKITLANKSRLDSSWLNSFLGVIKQGDIIKAGVLERTLLLLNDLPGIEARATLMPGQAGGTADLIVEVKNGEGMSGQIYGDNYGNRFTGQERLGFSVAINEPNRQGDQLVLGGVTTGSDLNSANFAYSQALGGRGLRIGATHSTMHYFLGKEFASLDANGRATISGIFASYPFLRSRNASMVGQIGLDHRKLSDAVLGTQIGKVADVWSAGINGNWRDNLGGGGITSYRLTSAFGNLRFANSESADAMFDATTAQTAGSYKKANIELVRQQYLRKGLSLWLFYTGQYADKNLDSSEKLSLGGANGIRAYPQGEALGDQGYIFTGELRWLLPGKTGLKGDLTLAAYFDTGSVLVNKNPWLGSDESNRCTLSGVGLGIIWTKTPDFAIRLDYAWRITSIQAVADTDQKGRYWLQGVNHF